MMVTHSDSARLGAQALPTLRITRGRWESPLEVRAVRNVVPADYTAYISWTQMLRSRGICDLARLLGM